MTTIKATTVTINGETFPCKVVREVNVRGAPAVLVDVPDHPLEKRWLVSPGDIRYLLIEDVRRWRFERRAGWKDPE